MKDTVQKLIFKNKCGMLWTLLKLMGQELRIRTWALVELLAQVNNTHNKFEHSPNGSNQSCMAISRQLLVGSGSDTYKFRRQFILFTLLFEGVAYLNLLVLKLLLLAVFNQFCTTQTLGFFKSKQLKRKCSQDMQWYSNGAANVNSFTNHSYSQKTNVISCDWKEACVVNKLAWWLVLTNQMVSRLT